MSGVRLTPKRYKEIESAVVEMFEECGLHTVPIDCFAIADKLYYRLKPYSSLPLDEQWDALEKSEDGFSCIEQDPFTKMYAYVIYYNDYEQNLRRVRFTIFHEIGHIYLGHLDDREGKDSETLESEANFFARNAICPLPLMNMTGITDINEVCDTFDVSFISAGYICHAYDKWITYGPNYFLDHELKLIHMFMPEVA